MPALLLAACGFNGTDPTRTRPPVRRCRRVAIERRPFEEVSLADSEPRPTMQLQVVLDRQGFGPGVIDGREGLSTVNALKGFQEANDLEVTGELDVATRGALARWDDVAATRVVRIPESWGRETYREVPDEPEDQAQMDRLGYASIDERLAERFHTTVEVLHALNPGGRPAGTKPRGRSGHARSDRDALAAPSAPNDAPAVVPRRPAGARSQRRRRPRRRRRPATSRDWLRTLASLGVDAVQPDAARIVVDKSDGWLKAYDEARQAAGAVHRHHRLEPRSAAARRMGRQRRLAQPAVRLRSGPVLGRARPRGGAAAAAGAERTGRRGVDRPHPRALRHPRHARAPRPSAAPRATAACA